MSFSAVVNFRLGLGADPRHAQNEQSPRSWLLAQVNPALAIRPVSSTGKSSSEIVRAYLRAKEAGKMERKEMKRVLRAQFRADSMAMLEWSMSTQAPFAERWVQFWLNHFTVSTTRKAVAGLTGAYEREAIRSHCFGHFKDLLLSVIQHPAMLIYLDNVRSTGPNSRRGRKNRGLNENLAREILELHTLGVDGGYTQDDVLSFAKILTGWSLIRKSWETGPVFRFNESAHEPGAKTLLGTRYSAGESGGIQALNDLAIHPSTAQFISYKLAKHFVSDIPPKALVKRLAKSFQQSNGDLMELAKTLIDAPETWSHRREKLKTPYEWMMGVSRCAGWTVAEKTFGALRSLRQAPFTAPSPQGWSDDAADWMGPEAVLARLDIAERFGQRMARRGGVNSGDVASWLGANVSNSTQEALARANSPAQQWALLIMSPEFQRR